MFVARRPVNEGASGIGRSNQHRQAERQLAVTDGDAAVSGRSVSGGKVELVLQELGGPGYQGGIFYGTEVIIELDESKVRLLNGIFCHGASGCEPVPTPGHD